MYPLSLCSWFHCLPFVCCVSLSIQCTNKSVCVFLVASYTDGQPTENAEWFCKWLEEASTDFRYGKTYLKGLRYAVFGLGNSVYVGHYNTVRNGFHIKLYQNNNAVIQRISKAKPIGHRHANLVSIQEQLQDSQTSFVLPTFLFASPGG